MLTQKGVANIKDDEQKRTKEKMPTAWLGMTIVYVDKPDEEETREVYYLDSPEGLLPVELTFEEKENVSSVFSSWNAGLDQKVRGVPAEDEGEREGVGSKVL